jgi:hypothetical protein
MSERQQTVHHGAVSGSGGPVSESEIHLPGPSLSPPLLGLGVTILAFGVLFGLPLIIVGFGIFLIGLVTWLIDDARTFMQSGDQGHH